VPCWQRKEKLRRVVQRLFEAVTCRGPDDPGPNPSPAPADHSSAASLPFPHVPGFGLLKPSRLRPRRAGPQFGEWARPTWRVAVPLSCACLASDSGWPTLSLLLLLVTGEPRWRPLRPAGPSLSPLRRASPGRDWARSTRSFRVLFESILLCDRMPGPSGTSTSRCEI
jgi:hypothetical protein